MKTKTKIGLSLVPVAIAGVAAFRWIGYINWLEEEYPQYDRKILSKAFRTMMSRSLLGCYNDLNLDDDRINTRIFEEILKEQNPL